MERVEEWLVSSATTLHQTKRLGTTKYQWKSGVYLQRDQTVTSNVNVTNKKATYVRATDGFYPSAVTERLRNKQNDNNNNNNEKSNDWPWLVFVGVLFPARSTENACLPFDCVKKNKCTIMFASFVYYFLRHTVMYRPRVGTSTVDDGDGDKRSRGPVSRTVTMGEKKRRAVKKPKRELWLSLSSRDFKARFINRRRSRSTTRRGKKRREKIPTTTTANGANFRDPEEENSPNAQTNRTLRVSVVPFRSHPLTSERTRPFPARTDRVIRMNNGGGQRTSRMHWRTRSHRCLTRTRARFVTRSTRPPPFYR